MQTSIPDSVLNSEYGREADQILRSCVHCGFCNATCPTYQLLGDELDGPRGRIYQIKQVLENQKATSAIQGHLDRCLTCRNCETTCPSGVKYGRLLDIGRKLVEESVKRSLFDRLLRKTLRLVLPYRNRFDLLLRCGQLFRPLLPDQLKRQIPRRQKKSAAKPAIHKRKMLLLNGCVQPGLRPTINAAAIRVFDRLGITLEAEDRAGCCGALSYHMSAEAEAEEFARTNIDAWWPHIENGAEAIVITASGCATMAQEYGQLLKDDPAYRDKASKVSELMKDISEVLENEDLTAWPKTTTREKRIAFHSPCTLQHGLQRAGTVESILTMIGYELTLIPDAHLCCGSAGTYSILQRTLSSQLRAKKLVALQSGRPDRIVTANIGCLTHLGARSEVPVQHWIELL